jgi:hypothetical protein
MMMMMMMMIIIIIMVSTKYGLRVWTGFIWLRIGISGGLL